MGIEFLVLAALPAILALTLVAVWIVGVVEASNKNYLAPSSDIDYCGVLFMFVRRLGIKSARIHESDFLDRMMIHEYQVYIRTLRKK
jgi:hypothetical protein